MIPSQLLCGVMGCQNGNVDFYDGHWRCLEHAQGLMNKTTNQKKTGMQPQQFTIEIPIYNRKCHVFINLSDEDVKKALLSVGHEEEESEKASSCTRTEVSAACAYIFDDRNSLIRLEVQEVDPVFFDCVAHEIFHVAAAVLDYMGIKLDDSSEEAYAYLIGYITRQFYEKLST